eukprot:UN00892
MSFYMSLANAGLNETQARVTHIFAKHHNLVYRILPRTSDKPIHAWLPQVSNLERIKTNTGELPEALVARFENHWNMQLNPYAVPKKRSILGFKPNA